MEPIGGRPKKSPECPVLKKAGIVVAVAATGLLVTTPIASAAPAPAQASNNCTFTQSGGSFNQTLVGGSSGIGVGGAVIGVLAPVTAQTQALNCTAINVSDLVDVNSGNTTSSSVRTRIQNSFNRTFIFRR
jgi:hypothetical protein